MPSLGGYQPPLLGQGRVLGERHWSPCVLKKPKTTEFQSQSSLWSQCSAAHCSHALPMRAADSEENAGFSSQQS